MQNDFKKLLVVLLALWPLLLLSSSLTIFPIMTGKFIKPKHEPCSTHLKQRSDVSKLRVMKMHGTRDAEPRSKLQPISPADTYKQVTKEKVYEKLLDSSWKISAS